MTYSGKTICPLHRAQQTQVDYVNRHRLPSSFNFGDRVWLLRQHIKTTRSCEKLDYRRLGPFLINGKIYDVTFCLDLHLQLRIHPVFHSSLLEPYQESIIPDRITPPPPPIKLEDGPEYEVVAFLDSKIVWLGYSPIGRLARI